MKATGVKTTNKTSVLLCLIKATENEWQTVFWDPRVNQVKVAATAIGEADSEEIAMSLIRKRAAKMGSSLKFRCTARLPTYEELDI